MTTCPSKRLFSTLKRIKIYLESTLEDNQQNGLTLLNIHPEIQIKPAKVVDMYANKHSRCVQQVIKLY